MLKEKRMKGEILMVIPLVVALIGLALFRWGRSGDTAAATPTPPPPEEAAPATAEPPSETAEPPSALYKE